MSDHKLRVLSCQHFEVTVTSVMFSVTTLAKSTLSLIVIDLRYFVSTLRAFMTSFWLGVVQFHFDMSDVDF